jgi:hypothetical protein
MAAAARLKPSDDFADLLNAGGPGLELGQQAGALAFLEVRHDGREWAARWTAPRECLTMAVASSAPKPGDPENVAQDALHRTAGGVDALQAAQHVAGAEGDAVHGQRDIGFAAQTHFAFGLVPAWLERGFDFFQREFPECWTSTPCRDAPARPAW